MGGLRLEQQLVQLQPARQHPALIHELMQVMHASTSDIHASCCIM